MTSMRPPALDAPPSAVPRVEDEALSQCLHEQRRCVGELGTYPEGTSEWFLVRRGLEDWLGEEILTLAEFSKERYQAEMGAKDSSPRQMRLFETGATRNVDENKLNYRGFLDPLVLRRFAEYMHTNRKQADGKFRDADNWKKGIPKQAYLESGWRHFFDWYTQHEGYQGEDELEVSLCALLFNVQGYLYELLKERGYGRKEAK